MGLLDGTTQQTYYQGNDHGGYQFTSLTDIINQFMMVYVGEDKIIPKAKRLDVAFHAQRALAELSFDTLKSVKAQEITLPPSLQMTLPQDYVNYTKVSWVDSAGIKHLLYPASKTSNPGLPSVVDSISAFGRTTSGSGVVVLDGQYDDILPGMTVSSNAGNFNIFSGTVLVESVSLAGGVTTVVMDTNSNVSLTAGQSAAPFEFGTGPIVRDLVIVESNVYFDTGDTYITSNNSSGDMDTFASLVVGMTIVHEDFPGGTVVTSLQKGAGALPDVVYVDQAATGDFFGSISLKHENNTSSWYNRNISTTASNYKSSTPSQNQNDNYQDDIYWPMDGSRYGLDPQHAQANGSFYIDDLSGKIHFSSNVSGKTVILDYISDSLGTDGEMQVHKFAEEAMYKWISHAILAGRANIPEYQVNRFKKERFAAIRTAKLRLSNLKLEELTQILRGKSKQIKH